jgi:hypothetical protein
LLVTPGAYPRRKHLKGAPIGLAPPLYSNSNTQLERVSKDKQSSLLGLIVSNEGKKFDEIETRGPEVVDHVLGLALLPVVQGCKEKRPHGVQLKNIAIVVDRKYLKK